MRRQYLVIIDRIDCDDAASHGAEALALTCPLCDYNIGKRQDQMFEKYEGAKDMPVYYFTQLLALALGIDPEASHLELNRESARELLKTKSVIQ